MNIPFLKNRVSGNEKAFLARQLATMISSGLTIDRAIAILGNQTTNTYLKEVLKQIDTDLEAGLPFSTAMAKHPKVFNRVFVNVVIAGEAVGKVAEVLSEMAERLEKDQELGSKLRAALYYPVFIFVAMIVVGILVVARVVPQLETLFTEAKVALPWTTQLLISVSHFLEGFWWLAILGIIGLIVAFRLAIATPKGKEFSDGIALKLPVALVKDMYMARFTRTLSLLLQSGTPIIESLAITGEVMNNRYYSTILVEAKDEISRGIPLSVPLSKSPLFPIVVPQMIAVGEQSGRLDQVLNTMANYYEEEANTKIRALSSLFEPAMILVIGIAVAFIVFSVFMPIYQIAQFS